MIHFERYENKVKVIIEYKTWGYKANLWLYWNADSEVAADAVVSQIIEQYQTSIEAELKAAYEQGWKDAKAKRKKQTWFKSTIKHFRS